MGQDRDERGSYGTPAQRNRRATLIVNGGVFRVRTAALSSIETRVFKLLCAIRRDPLYLPDCLRRGRLIGHGSVKAAAANQRGSPFPAPLGGHHVEAQALGEPRAGHGRRVDTRLPVPPPPLPARPLRLPPRPPHHAKPAPSRPAPSASDAQRVDAVAAYVNDATSCSRGERRREQLTLFLMRSQAMPDSFMRDTRCASRS